jgi:hypothetical protein
MSLRCRLISRAVGLVAGLSAGGAFADSPLVRTENCFAVGIGIAWIFRESCTLVKAEE